MRVSHSELYCRDYHRVVDEVLGLSADVSADVVDNFDEMLLQKAFWKTDGDSFFTAGGGYVVRRSLKCLSNKFLASDCDIADLVRSLIDDVEASHTPTSKAEKEFVQQRWLVTVAKNMTSKALNDGACLPECVAAAGKLKEESLVNASAASAHIPETSVELSQARDSVSMQSKMLTKFTQLKMSIKVWRSIDEASGDDSEGNLAEGTAESSQSSSFLTLVVHWWMTCGRS